MASTLKNVLNGWTVYAHPAFIDAYAELLKRAERAKAKNPDSYQSNSYVKLLAMVHKITSDITRAPGGAQFRQGGTLGSKRKHWFRGKFGNGRYRLFYRHDSASKTIILGWLNGEQTLRTKGDKQHDAYEVFKRMLNGGNPPDSWVELLAECLADKHEPVSIAALVDAIESKFNNPLG